jgi:type VI protein secretion system component VasK
MTEIDALQTNLSALLGESQALRMDVRDAERARRRASIANLALLIIALAVVALVLTVSWQNNRLGNQNRDLGNQIRSCTTPQGVCYQQSQRRTSDAVRQIVQSLVWVEQCSRTADTDTELEQCVTRKLQTPRN